MVEVKDAEDFEEVGIGDALTAHNAERIWVDDLLTKRASREIRTLRDIEDLREGRFADGAAVDGPQAAKDAEE